MQVILVLFAAAALCTLHQPAGVSSLQGLSTFLWSCLQVNCQGAELSAAQRTRLSKALSHLLRHDAVRAGLHIDAAGYLSVQEALAVPSINRLRATEHQIEQVVQHDQKQRFHLTQDGRIRCNQGHSGLTAAALVGSAMCTAITLQQAREHYPEVLHGTYARHLRAIQSQGLLRGQRKHIHLTPLRPGDQTVMSGFRASSEVLIHIDMAAAIESGIAFWLSANGVILTEGDGSGCLPPKYICQIEHLK